MAPATLSEGSQEPVTPMRIGAGSFGAIYAFPGRPLVAKVVHVPEHATQIEKEFRSLHDIHTICNSNSVFAVPRALALYKPDTQDIIFFPPSPVIGRQRQPRRPFEPTFFAGLPPPPAACYVMDRVSPLPTTVGEIVRSRFYPPRARQHPTPLMCRLYFGRQLKPSAFVNPNNFPLDITRYDSIYLERQHDFDPKEDVVWGMGEMLSTIHWMAGYDARDIEFVLAGSPTADTPRLYVIDFNQMRTFDRDNGDVASLVEAFFSNDPYYPRPIPHEPLYETFKKAYLDCSQELFRARAQLFLQAIESFQAARDTKALDMLK